MNEQETNGSYEERNVSEAERVLGSMPAFDFKRAERQREEYSAEKTGVESEVLNKMIADNPNKYFRQGFFAALSEDKIGELTPEQIMAGGYVAEQRKRYSNYKGEQWNNLFVNSFDMTEINKISKDISTEFSEAFPEEYVNKMKKNAVESALATGARMWVTGHSHRGYNTYKEVACLIPRGENSDHKLGGLLSELDINTENPFLMKKTLVGMKNICENSEFEYSYGKVKSINKREALDFYLDTFDYEKHHMMSDVVGVFGYEEFYDSYSTGGYNGSREYVKEMRDRPECLRYVERVKEFRHKLVDNMRQEYVDDRPSEVLKKVKGERLRGLSRDFTAGILEGKPKKIPNTVSLGTGNIPIPDIEEQTKALDIRAEDVIGGHWSEFKYLYGQLSTQLATQYELTEEEKRRIISAEFGNIIERGICKRKYEYDIEYSVFHAMEGSEDYSRTERIGKECFILDAYTGDSALYDDSYRFVVVKDRGTGEPTPHYLTGAPQESTEQQLDDILGGYVDFEDEKLRKRSFKGFLKTINFMRGAESRQAQWYFEKFKYDEHIDELMSELESLDGQNGYVGLKERFDEFMQIRQSE